MKSKRIGLVLAGGGGKGAYHIGFWKALSEFGLDKDISCISGTSVGALNACLFSQGDYTLAENIWLNIKEESILNQNQTQNTISLNDVFKGEMGLFSKTGIRQMVIDHVKFDQLTIPTYATVTEVETANPELFSLQAAFSSLMGQKIGKAEYIKLNDLHSDDALKYLLASSAIPMIYPAEKINGKLYFDGGLADNSPVLPLYNFEKCDIMIVVHLSQHLIIDKNQYPNTNIIEIYPSQNLGGMLGFSKEEIEVRFNQGYMDTIRIIKPLLDKIKTEKVLETV